MTKFNTKGNALKKLLTLFLVIALALVVFCSCEEDSAAKKPESNSDTISDNSGNIYEYDENGSLESIKYYHGYEIVPVQYFLGEGALMDSTDLTTDVVFMPLSKVLAKQNQQ